MSTKFTQLNNKISEQFYLCKRKKNTELVSYLKPPLFQNRKWEVLPALPMARANHGCGSIEIANSKHLLVFGGRSTANTLVDTSILFLNLNNVNEGWKTIGNMKINSAQKYINGNLVKLLTPTECDLMYITDKEFHVCKGNFTWVVSQLPVAVTSTKKFVPVGLNSLWPCANIVNN